MSISLVTVTRFMEERKASITKLKGEIEMKQKQSKIIINIKIIFLKSILLIIIDTYMDIKIDRSDIVDR